MSLSLYKKKRHFSKTPEPEGKEKSSKNGLRFVIQKHDASHLHYDFRLEMAGVLKSWAVPKGPSLNPADKRLAMMVEDHPYDYRDFEGIIPAGEYGGGTVIVWDEGFYEPLEGRGLSQKEQEKLLLGQLHAGNLKLYLHGQKIKGAYALFLMKARGERSWILQKKQDEFASDEDILLQDRSVKSGLNMIEVAEVNGTTVNHPELHNASSPGVRKTSRKKSKPARKGRDRTAEKNNENSIAEAARSAIASAQRAYKTGIRKKPMPKDVVPMLATLTGEPFDNDNWLFEIKWDGYRAVAYVKDRQVELASRNLSSFTERYFPVTEALKELKLKAVFDGEIVAVGENGLAQFQSLQNWQNTPVQLQYYIFDILWLEGFDLTGLPLKERKKILRQVIPPDHAVIKFSDHVTGTGREFFQAAIGQGLEGIMAKKADSPYLTDTRTGDWLKVKVNQRQEVIIAGFTEPRRSRQFFGSLLLGLYDGKELVYIGHTGSGFTKNTLESIYKKLQPLVTDECPFAKCPKGNMPVTWVKPKLVCEIKFTEWTKDRMARHPIFMGLRTDKKPKEVHFEKAAIMAGLDRRNEIKDKAGKSGRRVQRRKSGSGQVVQKSAAPKKQALPSKKTAGKKTRASKKSLDTSTPVSKGKKTATAVKSTVTRTKKKKSTDNDKIEPVSKTGAPAPIVLEGAEDRLISYDGRELKLTNPGKLYWKKEGFTKGDMIHYYSRIIPFIMPYMKDRPQSLNRHPNGIDGPNFYQKDVRGKVPGWIQTHEDYSESTGETIQYLVCRDPATLIYMANLGCIEMHPWHSRTGSWEYPDWCLIDLDPDKGNSFDQVMETARVVKKILDAIGASAYCKTSGSTGIHIYIPLGARYNYDQSKQLAELVVTLVNQELPETTSVERSPSKRKGKIYLDYLQNRETQTAAAPYSLRPKPGVPVSTPIDWSELKKGLTPSTWNARNIFDRLKKEGDLFLPVLGKGNELEKIIGRLASLMK